MADLKAQMFERARQAAQRDGLRALQQQAAQMQAGQVETAISLPIEQITIDETIQVRVAGLDEEKVAQYAVIMAEKGELPPVIVFREPGTDVLYLADGFHRVAAAQRAGLPEIRAEVRPGGYEGAFEFAEDANLEHGLALSTQDKRAIFERRLARDHVWAHLSDREIAKVLGVSHTTIANWKSSLTGKNLPVSGIEGKKQTVLTADGRVMKTVKIKRANQKRASRKTPQNAEPAEPVGTFSDQSQEQTVTDRIMAALAAHGELGPAHLIQVSGLSYAEFIQVMNTLVEGGWVERRQDITGGRVIYHALVEVKQAQQPSSEDTPGEHAVRSEVLRHLRKAARGLEQLGEAEDAGELWNYTNSLAAEWKLEQ